jgi:FdhD protein
MEPMPDPFPATPPEPAATRRTVTRARALAVRESRAWERPERLATEEPMEIRAGGPGQEPVSVAVTMRTPGHDFELAVGFLAGEGVITSRSEVASVRYCELPPDEPQHYNVVSVGLTRPVDEDALRRHFYATSSCGICGKASLEQVEIRCGPLPPGPPVAASVVLGLPDSLRAAQRIFEQTGGLHAAGVFDRDGGALSVREDVGRHNALDKLVGRALLTGGLPLCDRVLMLSGRVSFELVQKAAVAGLPVVCAVSAPSSLAVETAEALGIAVVGFVRGTGFNVYCHPERIDLDA